MNGTPRSLRACLALGMERVDADRRAQAQDPRADDGGRHADSEHATVSVYGPGARKCAATFSYARGMTSGTSFTPFVKTATT